MSLHLPLEPYFFLPLPPFSAAVGGSGWSCPPSFPSSTCILFELGLPTAEGSSPLWCLRPPVPAKYKFAAVTYMLQKCCNPADLHWSSWIAYERLGGKGYQVFTVTLERATGRIYQTRIPPVLSTERNKFVETITRRGHGRLQYLTKLLFLTCRSCLDMRVGLIVITRGLRLIGFGRSSNVRKGWSSRTPGTSQVLLLRGSEVT